jgi:hypothetical protein
MYVLGCDARCEWCVEGCAVARGLRSQQEMHVGMCVWARVCGHVSVCMYVCVCRGMRRWRGEEGLGFR